MLVLGGTGFIGSHVAETLARAGVEVVAASRSGSWRWSDRPPPGICCRPLDLTDASCAAELAELVRSADGIVNLAGSLARPGVGTSSLAALHVGGTRRLHDAVATAARRPARVVHVSTTGVLGPTGASVLDEDAAPRPASSYETTKLEGERIALDHCRDGIEVVVARPGLVYGPRDLHLLPLYRAIRDGTFRLIAGGRARWQPIHVADVAEGIVRALDGHGCARGIFHLAGAETVSVADLCRRIAATLGRRIRGPVIPAGLAYGAGLLLEIGCRPFGIDPPLSRARVRTLTEHRLYRTDRAREALGFSPRRGLDAGIVETVEWYRRHGYL